MNFCLLIPELTKGTRFELTISRWPTSTSDGPLMEQVTTKNMRGLDSHQGNLHFLIELCPTSSRTFTRQYFESIGSISIIHLLTIFYSSSEAHKLVRAHTRKHREEAWRMPPGSKKSITSGQVTPNEEERFAEDFVARPEQYRGGILSNLLKLYNVPPGGGHSRVGSASSTNSPSQIGSTASSGFTTPRTKATKWYEHKNQLQETQVRLNQASAKLAAQQVCYQNPRTLFHFSRKISL